MLLGCRVSRREQFLTSHGESTRIGRMGVETKIDFPFSVDTWTPISKRKPFHFLTHAHKDHTVGIESHGTFPIYCTSLTEKLVSRRYPKLNPSIFKSLEIGEPKLIGDADQGFTVTAYDANHCPGAIMLLFEGSFGNVLHTGDCRLTSECLNQLMDYVTGSGRVLDCVYLDCTFGAEPMVMPSKEEAIAQVKRCIWNHPSDTKVYLACDMLGQETLLEAVAKGFSVKIFVDKDRLSSYYADLEVIAPEFLTTDKESTRFEICEGYPNFYERALQTMNQSKKEGRIQPLFIRPSTQWYVFEERLQGDGSGVISTGAASSRSGATTKRRSATSSLTQATKDEYGVYRVCYSMHSSQHELKAALKLLNPAEVISTTPHCGVCDLEKSFTNPNPNPNPNPTPNPNTVSNDAIVEGVKHCVLEDREFKKGRKNYSCSPSKTTNNNSNVGSPQKPIPLFGYAQYVLPASPTFPCPSSSVRISSPAVAPVSSDSFLPISPSQVSSQGLLTSSQHTRAKRLFVEPDPNPNPNPNPNPEVQTSCVPRKSPSRSPTSKIKHCVSDPMLSLVVDEPNMAPPVALSSPYHRSVSMPVAVASHEDIRGSHNVSSKNLSRLPTRRKFRIPEPLPSLLDMKRNGE